MQFDAVGAFGEAGRPVIEPHHIGVGLPRAGGEKLVQIGAVKLGVRRAMQLFLRQRKALDHLTGVMQAKYIGLWLDANRQQLVLEAQVPHHVHGVGADLDARADLGKRRGLLIDFDRVPGLHQARGRGQAAQSGAGDENSVLLHSNGSRSSIPASF